MDRRPADRGLPRDLRKRNFRVPPDPEKVKEFAKYLRDPRMRNSRGIPRYSKIFRFYGVDCYTKGFTAGEMATPQYPEEIDSYGCPSPEAVKAITGYLKRITKRYKGNLELYATPGVRAKPPHRREWRWHITRLVSDTKKQVDSMMRIAKSIEVSAKEREANQKKAFPERMEKADLLDRFFDSEDGR
jgi:hypothetical protein